MCVCVQCLAEVAGLESTNMCVNVSLSQAMAKGAHFAGAKQEVRRQLLQCFPGVIPGHACVMDVSLRCV